MAANFKGNKSMKITQAQRKLKAILTGIGVITTLMFGLSAHAATPLPPGPPGPVAIPMSTGFSAGDPGTITGLNSLCVDVAHSGTSNGTPIQLWDCNNTNAQRWWIGGRSGNEIVNPLGYADMSILGGRNHSNDVVEWVYGVRADRWLYQNMELVTNGGKCIDVPGQNFRDGQAVQLYDCNGSAAQQWTYEPSTHLLRAAKNNMCLDARAYGTSNGTVVQIWTCTGASNQQWIPSKGGFASGILFSFACLDVDANGKNANGTKIQLWSCPSDPNIYIINDNQRFALRGQIKNATTGQCLDVPHSHAVAGQQLQAYACNGTAAQRWTMWSPD